jgi:carbon monoxide dehydrogenase subunit G
MTKVSTSTKLPVSADIVWSVVGQFNALAQWHPAVEKSEEKQEKGARIRTLNLVGGGVIAERLENADNDARSYSYSIQDSPLPVENYRARITVRADNVGCAVEWSSEFEPKGVTEGDATAAIQGIYEMGFENLRKMYGAEAALIEITVSQRFASPASAVWSLVRDFNALPEWIPGIRGSELDGEGVGCTRRLDISALGGRWVVERLESLDDEARRLVYTIVDGSLPLQNYTSTMTVESAAGEAACTLLWHAVFDPKDASKEEAEAFVRGAYGAGIETLKGRFGTGPAG